ncbi:MAG: hypothetical protein LBU40_06105, partial [Methanobrevibacter sp.]|nr:hypothetical protein [Methanobrevibacter sp.]
NNLKNGIKGEGNNNLLKNNSITNNSKKTKNSAIYFKGNHNNYTHNKIHNNGYHGIHTIGKGNKIAYMTLKNNKNTQAVIQGNNNLIYNLTAYNSSKSGITIIGNNNKLFKSKTYKNKIHGLVIKGNNNKINKTTINSNNNTGILINGSNNKLIQNTIRSNNIGIYNKIGKNNLYGYNNIVNKKYNLYLKKGQSKAEFNWWGKNEIYKVKNAKINKYVIAKLVAPETISLKKKQSFYVIFKDSKNKKLKLSILSLNLKSSFYNGDNKIFTKNLNVSKNKGEIANFNISKLGIYSLKSQIDSQLLFKNYFMLYDKKGYSSDNKKFSKYMGTAIAKASESLLGKSLSQLEAKKGSKSGFDVGNG